MNYFRNFPVISYDINGTSPPYYTIARNIMVRNKIREAIIDKIITAYSYKVEDGDRPDIIATHYYGSPTYTWLIFAANGIKDPYYDWPLESLDFETYLESKYGSVSTYQTEVHEYYQIIRAATTNDSMVDDDAAINPEVRYVIDSTTYDSLASASRGIYYKYDWEFDVNEAKRQIQLIDLAFADRIMAEAGAI